MPYFLTHHVEARMKQRGIRKNDIERILTFADQVAPDAYLMTNGIVDEEIARLKKEIKQLERLRGKKLIIEGGAVITAYHARHSDQTKTLRKGRTYA